MTQENNFEKEYLFPMRLISSLFFPNCLFLFAREIWGNFGATLVFFVVLGAFLLSKSVTAFFRKNTKMLAFYIAYTVMIQVPIAIFMNEDNHWPVLFLVFVPIFYLKKVREKKGP